MAESKGEISSKPDAAARKRDQLTAVAAVSFAVLLFLPAPVLLDDGTPADVPARGRLLPVAKTSSSVGSADSPIRAAQMNRCQYQCSERVVVVTTKNAQ